MTSDELLSKTINYLRFPLTVGVVFIHFNLVDHPISLHGVQYGLNQPDWFRLLVIFFSGVLPQIGVPLFFVISGFLFFYRGTFERKVYKQKLKKRMKTLLVPFLLWNVLAILVQLLYQIPFLFPHATKVEVHFSIMRVFHTFFANFANEGIFVSPDYDKLEGGGFPYPINLSMWYVRDLVVMVLVSPLVYWLIRRMRKWLVIALGLVYYFYQPLFVPNGSWGVLLSQAAFFFSWGAFYSINKTSFVDCFRRYRLAPLLYLPIAVVDALTMSADYNLFIHEAGVIIGVVAVVVVVASLLETGRVKVNETLAGSSFFVYALHLLIINDLSRVVISFARLSNETYSVLLLYAAVPLLTSALCVWLYVLLKRYVPSLCYLLTGGR